MRVAGVDPGLTRCGLALVSVGADRTATLEDVRVIGSPSEVPLDQRLLTISERIDAWLDEFRPDALAIERVFTYTNVSTVMGTAQAMGVIIAAAARRAWLKAQAQAANNSARAEAALRARARKPRGL